VVERCLRYHRKLELKKLDPGRGPSALRETAGTPAGVQRMSISNRWYRKTGSTTGYKLRSLQDQKIGWHVTWDHPLTGLLDEKTTASDLTLALWGIALGIAPGWGVRGTDAMIIAQHF
jgi:hypothetical protein